jgi:leader peptidase (prepilin peptidase)/N-methyltransferase
MMEIIFYILMSFLVFMLGAALGSFFNVVLLRTPEKEDFVKTRSYCPECKHTLKWYELVPVFSFWLQKGRCRKCMARMSPQYLLMELFCGGSVLWAFLALGFSRPHVTLLAMVLFPVLVSLSAEDIKKTEIPYWCSATIAVLGIVKTVLSLFLPTETLWWEHLLGALLISVPFAIFSIFGAMGGGDVQLVAAAGLLLGFAIVPAVLIAIVSGAVFGIILKIKLNLSKKRATICFGPFLAFGIAVGYLYGYQIIQAYTRLMS